MGVRETLGKFVPESLKPPIQPSTYDAFLETLRAQNAKQVTAIPGKKTLLVTEEDEGFGEDGAYYEYNITFNAIGRRGRKVDYYHSCARKFLDNPDYINKYGGKMGAERLIHTLEEAYLITTFVTAAKLEEIEEMIPGCQTKLQDATKVFTAEDFEELQRLAQQLQIRPW